MICERLGAFVCVRTLRRAHVDHGRIVLGLKKVDSILCLLFTANAHKL